MKTLIIYAHPDTDGYNPRILNEIRKQLRKKKTPYDLIDLYKDRFDPVLHEEEHYTSKGRKISRKVKNYQEKIKKAKKLIFLFPVWWNSTPAILKGFFDKVLTSGFAFKYVGKRPVGLLKGQTATVMFTSGGPTWMYKLFLDMPAMLIKHNILGFCGIKAKTYQLGGSRDLTPERIVKIQKLVRRAI